MGLAATPGIIRLFRFRPLRAAFDAILRDEMIPDLLRLPGLRDVHVGRQGPGDLGPRLVASIWDSRAAMAEAVGEDFDPPTFHPERLAETTDRELLWLPLAFSWTADIPGRPSVLRLVTGRVRPDELDAYVAEARSGTIDDATAGHGPLTLHLAARPPDRFLTLSTWPDWPTLQEATGGDVGRPIATRHAERLLDWGASHFEVIPTPHPPAASRRPR
ncbi:MAG TPA: hypothetical protein VFX65_11775 [Candidatus Limnocylindrales bacterium]|nr:hypothetical protein [Candidatus Limnocylindrales bacterium]